MNTKTIFAVVVCAVVGVLAAAMSSNAAAAVQAQAATVMAVEPGTQTQEQRSAYARYAYGQGYERTNSRAIVAGILGTALGALAARHSSAGWYGAGIGGAVGTAVGAHMDADAARKAAATRALEQIGYQVVLKTHSGQTEAVFVRGQLFAPGEHVWLIGQSEVIPAN